MKKIISVFLLLSVLFALFIPIEASAQTHTIFNCDYDEGTGCHATGWGFRWGPVSGTPGEYPEHPAPVEGTKSYCNTTDTGKTVLYYNNTGWHGATGVLNATQWDYVECELYSSEAIVFDWAFGFCTNQADANGASWKLKDAYLPEKTWIHVRMPIHEFGNFSGEYPESSMENINRIKMEFINCADPVFNEVPLELYLYMDNVVVTKDGAGKKNELVDQSTWEEEHYSEVEEPSYASSQGEYSEYEFSDEISDVTSEEPSSESQLQKDVEEYSHGDVNGDGFITAADALTVLQYSVQKITLTEIQDYAADVTLPLHVNSTDALHILQYSVKKLKAFSPPDRPDPLGPSLAEDYILENEAYVPDDSADNTFVIDNKGLQDKTIYQVKFETQPTIHELRMIYAFQGIVNRDFGRDRKHTSLIFFNMDASDPYWYSYITQEGNYFNQYNKVVITDVKTFYTTFAYQLKQCGYILWDPNVPSTSNVALTICGVDGYLPVQAGTVAETVLKELGMTQKMSLVGMFADGAETLPGSTTESTKSAKNDAYLWALENYFSRCSSKYLAYTLDGAQDVETSVFSQMRNAYIRCYENHDYIVARRAFVFDLTPYNGEVPCDDKNQTRGTDTRTMKTIFNARYERANGEFGQLLGFPPWWLKYTADAAFPDGTPVGSKAATWIEWLFSEIITCYNLAKEADAAGPAHMCNGSVYYKYRVPNDMKFENNQPESVTFNRNVHYFTIYMGDYDSSAWMKQHVWNFWENQKDPARGQIPLNWAFNPNLSYRVPMAFQYVYERKSSKDFFIGGDSGAGYVIPSGLKPYTLSYSRMRRPANYNNGLDKWAEYSSEFYRRLDMDITGFIINGSNPIDEDIMACFNKFSPKGSFHNTPSHMLSLYEGVPYIYLNNGINHNTPASNLYDHSFNRMGGYNFSGYRTVCITPSQAKTIVDNFVTYSAGRGKTVQYVSMETLFDLVRQSGQGTVIK